MAKRIDSAMQFVPTFVREEVEHDLARGRRGPFSDAVVPLNDALVERADRIRTLEAVVAQLKAEREEYRAAMRRALGDVEWAIKTVCRYDPPGFPPNHIGKRLDGAATHLRQRLEVTT